MAKSVFQPIYEDLLSRIQDGRLLPGMPLPSENTLAVQYGTSRPTIRRAIGLLVEKSLVIRQPGIGSIVAQHSRSTGERKLKIGIDWNPSESYHNTAFYSDKLLSGILAAAEPHGHTVKFLPRTHRELYAKELDGIILTSILPTREEESSYVTLAKQGIPVVLLNRFPVSKELSYISVDYYKETYRVIDRMIRNGARRIALYGPDGYSLTQFSGRVAAWQDAHRANGIPVDPELTVRNSLPESMEKFIHVLKNNPPDVIFILHGNNTLSLMPVISSLNIRIPEDLALFCFDDIAELGETMKIPFSFIKMPLKQMGERAVNYIEEFHLSGAAPLKEIATASVEVKECRFLI